MRPEAEHDIGEGQREVTAIGQALLAHAHGLHARPAIKLTQLAKRFAASIRVALAGDGPWTDVKSIAKVMAMKTPGGVMLFFEADGEDSNAAVAALVGLVESDFADNDDAETITR